jgi:DNA polymerase III epsilon subunit-like protein
MNYTEGTLELQRPLIAIDVETDDIGTPEDLRIVELGFHIEYPDRRPPKQWCKIFNPCRPIAPGAIATHGISDAEAEQGIFFEQVASNLARGFSNCDFCGYNIMFDMRVVKGEMNRAGVRWDYKDAKLLDPLKLWQLCRRRTLSDAVEEFLHRQPTQAHRALGDATDALEVGVAMIRKFDEMLPRDISKLHHMAFAENKNFIDSTGKFQWKNGTPIIAFGKHRGAPLEKVNKEYLEWICRCDFPEDAKLVARNALTGQYPKRT